MSSVLQGLISLCLHAGKPKVLAVTFLSIPCIAFLDWWTGTAISLGVLYIFPMMLAGTVLRPIESAALAVFCACCRAAFDAPGNHVELGLRFLFALVAYFSSSLFVIALVKNRGLVVDNLAKVQREQVLRHKVEEQLRTLVESSPAAILTLNEAGTVLAANHAAHRLLAIPETQVLVGRDIGPYLPILSDALRLQIGAEEFRTAAQCTGQRENGDIFLAHTWFSSYKSPDGSRLAAIVVDSSDEMRDREEQNLRELMTLNRIAAAAVSHEVRNVCAAIGFLLSKLGAKNGITSDSDFAGVLNLIRGLEKIASLNLYARNPDSLQHVPLQVVLDTLRIVIESDWREINGCITWPSDADLSQTKFPNVVADPHGLLQALLNLAKNSYKAVLDSPRRNLTIALSEAEGKVFLRLKDSGPGIADPQRLFQPFQSGSDGTGLGLYISRAIVRSYGGDLRLEPQEAGSCFLIELLAGD